MISALDIDAILPQTQCGECAYPGCMPYAQALVKRETTIDRCLPGGESVIFALSKLLAIDATPYLPARTKSPALAVINESECIGCTKCIQACPVDAIIGSAKLMHSVIGDECTGCGLCIDPCPVDCIEMVAQPVLMYDSALARQRFNAKKVRILRAKHEKRQIYRAKRLISAIDSTQGDEKQAKQNYILQALARSSVLK